MIAVDTNVLVRYLVRDVERQAEAARVLLDGLTEQQPGFVCREVAIETVWVLERAYGFARSRITDALIELIATGGLVFEDADDVVHAAARYRDGRADFADLMILAAARRVSAEPLYTFDVRLAREDGAALVEVRPT